MSKAKGRSKVTPGKKRKVNKKAIAAAAVGLGLLAAGGAYLASSKGLKARRQISIWAKAAKKDLEKQVKKAGTLNKAVFTSAASEVVKRYKQMKKLDARQAGALLADLNAQWSSIKRQFARKGLGEKSKAKRMKKRHV